jgi:hypothetical protein
MHYSQHAGIMKMFRGQVHLVWCDQHECSRDFSCGVIFYKEKPRLKSCSMVNFILLYKK